MWVLVVLGFDDLFDDLHQAFVWLLLLVVDRCRVYLLVAARFCSPPSPPLVGRVLGASVVLVATCLIVAGNNVLSEGEHCCAKAPLTGDLRC